MTSVSSARAKKARRTAHESSSFVVIPSGVVTPSLSMTLGMNTC